MRTKKTCIVLAVIILFLFDNAAHSESEIVQRFKTALNTKDAAGMTRIVKENMEKIPAEVNSILEEALPQGSQEREAKFEVAEFMADEYKNVTGDIGLLKGVKRRVFESRLDKPVVSAPAGGVHIVESASTETVKNFFKPDNIIIKKGDVVRWVNRDDTAHLLASVRVIGSTGIFSPAIEQGQSWEYRFDKPGEYYYICFIHKVMYGKVTVLD